MSRLGDIIASIIYFYHEDDISRISAHSEDTLQINKRSVPAYFMEMTVL